MRNRLVVMFLIGVLFGAMLLGGGVFALQNVGSNAQAQEDETWQVAGGTEGFTFADWGTGRGPEVSLDEQLDDEEVIAVLAHERQHLRRRDPLRYLVLYALSAAAFMFPVMAALRWRQEARIELAADRMALAVAPHGALAGALLTVLNAPRIPVAGIASLTPTEARITQLRGHGCLPEIPTRLVIASVGLVAVILVAATTLASSPELVTMICDYCAGRV